MRNTFLPDTRFSFIILIFTVTLLVSCGPEDDQVKVACASNMISVFPVITQLFQLQHPGTRVTVSYGASGTLAGQILHGAEYDLFISADTLRPQMVFDAGAAAGPMEIYAAGKLVAFAREPLFAVRTGEPEEVIRNLLNSREDMLIAMANPDLAPYGKAAVEFLNSAGIREVSLNILTAENINQAAAYALSGADLAFLPAAVLTNDAFRDFILNKSDHFLLLPSNSYSRIDQAAVLTHSGSSKESAKALYDFLFSETAAVMFDANGYLPGSSDG